MFKKFNTLMETPIGSITIGGYTKFCFICTCVYVVLVGVYAVALFFDDISDWFHRKTERIKNFFSRFRRSATKG